MQHVTSISQFIDKEILEQIFSRAIELKSMAPQDYPKPLYGLTMATIFFEPSTRTRLSFETAIQNLGGQLITVENAGEFSSSKKGETLEDMTRTVNAYADGIVLRHPEIGAADRAASVSDVPIINAGDGAGQHPTQALLDLCTIVETRGAIDGLTIAFVGDLLNSRTVHSILPLLNLYDVEVYFVSPKTLQLSKKDLSVLKSVKYHQINNLDDVIDKIDVLYMTRVQRERFTDINDYNAIKDDFIITMHYVNQMKPDAIILHPLPRVNEIEVAVDADPRALHFEQVRNGLYTRMALLEYLYAD